MTILGTAGHRPHKGAQPAAALLLLAEEVLVTERPNSLVVGMATGWDMAMARAAFNLGIPYVAAVPFEGQESRWPDQVQAEYWSLLGGAAKVVHVSPPGFTVQKMHRRNQWIVDRIDRASVLWDGFDDSGTADFVRRARAAKIEPTNMWTRWQALRRSP